MRCAMAVLLALALAYVAPATARTVTDSAGRSVDIPASVTRVYAAGPPASILLYVLAPERLTGWPRPPRAEERPYIAAPYRDLPETGRLTGRGDTANLEVVLRDRPDLIVDFGSVRDTYVSLADRVQAQTGIPYLLIDGRFEATPAALRLMGEVLGVERRAEALARYVESLFAELDAGLTEIPAPMVSKPGSRVRSIPRSSNWRAGVTSPIRATRRFAGALPTYRLNRLSSPTLTRSLPGIAISISPSGTIRCGRKFQR